jgi:hypothetical protein
MLKENPKLYKRYLKYARKQNKREAKAQSQKSASPGSKLVGRLVGRFLGAALGVAIASAIPSTPVVLVSSVGVIGGLITVAIVTKFNDDIAIKRYNKGFSK